MDKKISTALISVFYKDELQPLVEQLQKQGTVIYSTGGTEEFIKGLGIDVVPVESLTSYPAILGGRVKTLHPLVFGGILGRRDNPQDQQEMKEYKIPEIDLVVVDLYPFQETIAKTKDEKQIIEKIDIGGPSMIRAAAKNFKDVTVVASKADYPLLLDMLQKQNGNVNLEQRRSFAAKAFRVVAEYDIAIDEYFNPHPTTDVSFQGQENILRYGENPHQHAIFYGDLEKIFSQLHGKEISYNNLVDIDAAIGLISEFSSDWPEQSNAVFAIIKHTNVCGISARNTVSSAWKSALAGDPESAFGGVLVSNKEIDKETAEAINAIFFEVLIAPRFSAEALDILRSKKNRILLQLHEKTKGIKQYKSLLNGTLVQDKDLLNFEKWEEAGGRNSSEKEHDDLSFANLVCKHLKSNAIALVKDLQLIGKGCGQTSRIDALRQAIEKSKQFKFDLHGAVMASDAFFPFDDCVKLGHEAGITAFIQPGGSIRDKDSIEYAKANSLVMVITGSRHFRH
jgi:phosphoribosylaminoimidazolecarboxamide formyltransferase / IMP cyclohydrolase